jgi:peptidoglycan/LPS O-acetylase OafA/YrhL
VVRSLTVTGVMPPILTRSLIGQTHFFAVGLALAVVSVSRSRHPERHRGVLVRHPLLACLVALGAFVAAGTVFGVNQPFSLLDWLHSDRASAAGHVLGNDLLVCLMAAMLISVAVFSADQSRLARATFGSRPLMFLGLVSYSLYLLHVPLIEWVAHSSALAGLNHALTDIAGHPHGVVALIAVPIVLAAATASYYAVERPFLRLKSSLDRPAEHGVPARV